MRAIEASTYRDQLDEQDLDAEQLVQIIASMINPGPSLLGPRNHEIPTSLTRNCYFIWI